MRKSRIEPGTTLPSATAMERNGGASSVIDFVLTDMTVGCRLSMKISPCRASKGCAEIVFAANDRCNQENLHAQLKHGVCALQAPVDNLVSNWAYMVMTALAWNLKAWLALRLPE